MAFTSSFYINGLFRPIKVDNVTIANVVKSEMERLGPGCSLNHIDVSDVTSLKHLFHSMIFLPGQSPDISEWDMSNAVHLSFMFARSNFNGDIGTWDLHNVKNMDYMFSNSSFNTDISNWNTENVINTDNMFSCGTFDKDISGWNVKKLHNAYGMFSHNENFNCDISQWELPSILDMCHMFDSTKFTHDVSNWSKYINHETEFSHMFFGTYDLYGIEKLFKRVKKQKLNEYYETTPLCI